MTSFLNGPRISPKEALSKPDVLQCRSLLKSIKSETEETQKLRKLWTAYVLGISEEALNVNKGFYEFAKKERLYDYLSFYDHRLQEDPATHVVTVLQEGAVRPWNEGASYKRYDLTGLTNKGLYEWTELKPFKIDQTPSRQGKYLLDLCCLCKGQLRLFGDHSWFRLQDDRGNVYSVGLYRSDNEIKSAFEEKIGNEQSPDVSEYWNEKIHTVSFEISKEQFLAIKKKVENRHRVSLRFQVIDRNCTVHVQEIARLAGIHIHTAGNFFSYFFPSKVYLLAKKFVHKFPESIQKVVRLIWCVVRYPFGLLANLAVLCMGGTRSTKDGMPYFRKASDFFTKMEFHSPYLLLNKIEKIKALRASEDDYSIPAQYRLSNS